MKFIIALIVFGPCVGFASHPYSLNPDFNPYATRISYSSSVQGGYVQMENDEGDSGGWCCFFWGKLEKKEVVKLIDQANIRVLKIFGLTQSWSKKYDFQTLKDVVELFYSQSRNYLENNDLQTYPLSQKQLIAIAKSVELFRGLNSKPIEEKDYKAILKININGFFAILSKHFKTKAELSWMDWVLGSFISEIKAQYPDIQII